MPTRRRRPGTWVSELLDILSVQKDPALHLCSLHQIVQTIDQAKQAGLAASGWTKEHRDAVGAMSNVTSRNTQFSP